VKECLEWLEHPAKEAAPGQPAGTAQKTARLPWPHVAVQLAP